MKIEVMFITPVKTAGHRYPAVVTFDDGPLVRALLKAGHAVLIDPPHLPGYNDDELVDVVAAPEPEAPAPVKKAVRKELLPEVEEPAVEEAVVESLIVNENQEPKAERKRKRVVSDEVIYEQGQFRPRHL